MKQFRRIRCDCCGSDILALLRFRGSDGTQLVVCQTCVDALQTMALDLIGRVPTLFWREGWAISKYDRKAYSYAAG